MPNMVKMNDEQIEYQKVHRQFRYALVAAFTILGIGTVVYHFVEELSWIDTLYFSTTTLTTVGYGDIYPHTNVGKLFTVIYIITGVGILAAFANLLIMQAVLSRKLKNRNSYKI